MRELMALPDLLTAVFAPPCEEPPSENPIKANFAEFLFQRLSGNSK
jgi:hypothetical protein